ncbi:MAG: tetratricopeptide repeat protein [Candidatus Sericytochromatia bacterium]|nr:tetratricopeptide repeat protein [Candidatus Sericytochromatia bacterium]
MMRRRFLSACLATLVLSLPAWAGYAEGQALYKEKKYAAAAVEYEKAVAAKPNDAMAFYKLGLTYAQLNRHADAVQVFEQAMSVDPTITSRSKIAESLDRSRQKAGGSASRPRNSAPQTNAPQANAGSSLAGQELIKALKEGPLVIEAGMRDKLTEPEAADLAAVLKKRSVVTKIALLTHATVRRDAPTLAAFAHKLSTYLALPTDAVVIVVTDKGVAAVSGAITATEMATVVGASLSEFSQGYAGGVRTLLAGIDARRTTKERQSSGFWFGFFAIGAGIGGFFWWRQRAKRTALKADINKLMGEFTDRMAAANDDLRYITDDPQATEAKQLFDESTAIYMDVDKRLAKTNNVTGLTTMVAGMRRAVSQMGHAQTMIKAIIDGKEPPKRSEMKEEDILPADQATARSVVGSPVGCFFCSRPTSPQEGSIIEVQQDGKSMRVLACPTCSASVAHGQTPQVAGYYDQGRFTPWYERQGYDYNRDRGGLSLMDLVALDYLFDHHRGYGYDQPTHWRHDQGQADNYMSDATQGTLSQPAESGGFWGSSPGSAETGTAAEGGFWGSATSSSSSDHS